jgi:serine/threonine protein kinase
MKQFGIGSLACYDCIDQVGEGTYGYVYKAKDRRNGEIVALKRFIVSFLFESCYFLFLLIRLIFHRESSGFPLNAVREIKFLKFLQHKNIVQLKDVISAKGCEEREMPIKADSLSRQEMIIGGAGIIDGGSQKRSRKTAEADAKTGGEGDGGDGTSAAVTAVTAGGGDGKDDTENDNRYDILKLCGSLYFVFEYIEHDLSGLIDSKYTFNHREIKCIIKQLLEALEYLHEKRIVHRDIKTSNILISNYHQIKLADFGLARNLPINEYSSLSSSSSSSSSFSTQQQGNMTNNVITLWYRPPELLLGSTTYSTTVDIWSTGCVLAELEMGRPFLPGRTEIEQLDYIFRTIGTPTDENWPGMTKLPNYLTMSANTVTKTFPMYGQTLRSLKLTDQTVGLLERMLAADPSRRASARNALTNLYFHSKPLPPNDPKELEPLKVTEGQSFHEYQTKQLRKQQQQQQQSSSSQPPAPPSSSITLTASQQNLVQRHSQQQNPPHSGQHPRTNSSNTSGGSSGDHQHHRSQNIIGSKRLLKDSFK